MASPLPQAGEGSNSSIEIELEYALNMALMAAMSGAKL